MIDYLLESDKLAEILKNIGAKDLVKTEEFPIHEKSLETCFYALVRVIGEEVNI